MSKKKIATLVTILVLSIAVAVPSIVSAAETDTSTRPGSITTYFKELIQGLVDNGKLSQSDADATLSSLDAKVAQFKANRPDKANGRIGIGPAGNLNRAEVATILGLTEDQLKEQLSTDTTLWKIAADAGKLDALKTAIIEKAQTGLAERVTEGRMTQEDADAALAELKEKVAAITADSEDQALGFLGGHGGPGRNGDFGGRTKGDRSKTPGSVTEGSTDTTTTAPSA